MKLEVCIDSLESAINAVHGGADELEVCSSLPEGGLTPSPGLVREILKMMDNISSKKPIYSRCCSKVVMKRPKVNIMIRCRGGSDFCYTPEEMDTMLSDIEYYKTLNIDRFVFGALTPTLEVDEESCSKIITAADPLPVTFHRAFDVCKNPCHVFNRISELGFNRLLTSGQKPSASHFEAIELLRKLFNINDGRIEIMPGAGVNANNAGQFVHIGFKIVHSSCKRSKELSVGNNLSMGTVSSEYIYYTDESIVRGIKEVISKAEDESRLPEI